MVENFVEKYVPIRIQSQISKTIHSVIKEFLPQCVERLEDYEQEVFGEMHQIVLEDDGMPDLHRQWRGMIFEIKKLNDEKYRAPKIISKLKESFVKQLQNFELEQMELGL